MGVTNPDANLDTIISPSHFKIDDLSKKDVIIVCGETMDNSRNGTNKGLRCFKQFEMKTSSTNVIIADAPHHHDLEKNPRVNKEIIIFSRKLYKIMK